MWSNLWMEGQLVLCGEEDTTSPTLFDASGSQYAEERNPTTSVLVSMLATEITRSRRRRLDIRCGIRAKRCYMSHRTNTRRPKHAVLCRPMKPHERGQRRTVGQHGEVGTPVTSATPGRRAHCGCAVFCSGRTDGGGPDHVPETHLGAHRRINHRCPAVHCDADRRCALFLQSWKNKSKLSS